MGCCDYGHVNLICVFITVNQSSSALIRTWNNWAFLFHTSNRHHPKFSPNLSRYMFASTASICFSDSWLSFCCTERLISWQCISYSTMIFTSEIQLPIFHKTIFKMHARTSGEKPTKNHRHFWYFLPQLIMAIHT